MPKLTGAQALIDCLLREGVDTVFGVPGGVLLPLYDAFYDSPIRNILARHEQGGAHMADGYARATGRVGVCIGTLRSRSHQPDHRNRQRQHGLHPDCGAHRPGAL